MLLLHIRVTTARRHVDAVLLRLNVHSRWDVEQAFSTVLMDPAASELSRHAPVAGPLRFRAPDPDTGADMPERIITDSRGQRWDVSQQAADTNTVVFRHQSGRELSGSVPTELNALSTEDLLEALDEARRNAGLDEVGHGGLDVALDDDGYETGR